MENLTGKQLGPYRIVAPVSADGIGAVYKAQQLDIDRQVAIKVLPRQFADDAQFLGRFEQEARVLAKLQHPHILPVQDYGQTQGLTYFVMPLVEGGNLADILSHQRLSLPQIGRVIAQIGEALDYGHGQGVMHYDVKPGNILVDRHGNCLLTNFGMVKIMGGSTGRLTLTGSRIGTPAYMSPEQGMADPLDGRSDIYALGVILYELVTGQVPFKAETPMALMIKHIQDPLPLPREIEPALPEPIERVIVKALAKQPRDRFVTAGKMVKALQGALQTVDTRPAAVQNGHPAPVADPPPQPAPPESQPTPASPQVAPVADPSSQPPSPKGQTAPVSLPIAPVADLSPHLSLPPAEPINPGQLLVWSAIGVFALALVTVLLIGVWFLRYPRFNQGLPPQLLQPVPGLNVGPLGPQPPAEAFEACRGAVDYAACTIQPPSESMAGACMPYQEQLVCMPTGGPSPQGP
jgi:serine/threonine-protein kinase